MGVGIALLAAAASPLWVGVFEREGVPEAPWSVVQMNRKVPPTRYRVARMDGVLGVEAVSEKSMALLARPVTVDFSQTPVLCWRWRVEAPVAAADMRRKAGDDYAARVYVAFDMPREALSASTRLKLGLARRIYGAEVPDAALSYVWDNRNPVGTAQKSSYTGRAQLIVAESGTARAGQWVRERHDVAADFAAAFDGAPGQAVQVALGSDTDNTGSSARAGFADLHFVGRGQACQF